MAVVAATAPVSCAPGVTVVPSGGDENDDESPAVMDNDDDVGMIADDDDDATEFMADDRGVKGGVHCCDGRRLLGRGEEF